MLLMLWSSWDTGLPARAFYLQQHCCRLKSSGVLAERPCCLDDTASLSIQQLCPRTLVVVMGGRRTLSIGHSDVSEGLFCPTVLLYGGCNIGAGEYGHV